MAQVVITEFMDGRAVEDLAADFDVHYDPELAERPASIPAVLGDALALIVRNKTIVDAALLDAGPQLQAIGRLGVGLDNIDTAACSLRDIAVFPATGANAESVAEYVIGALLVLSRPALTATDRVRSGDWPRRESIGGELSGKQMGLVGLGGIARLVAVKAAALGMRVMAFDPFLNEEDSAWRLAVRTPLRQLLETSDAISLHVPLGDSTHRLIDSAALAAMKPSALLVNTARGGIVDEAAVAAALEAGRLGGAALDVFESEPLAGASAAILAGAPNLILTPHIAGLTVESQARVSAVTAENVRRALRGADT